LILTKRQAHRGRAKTAKSGAKRAKTALTTFKKRTLIRDNTVCTLVFGKRKERNTVEISSISLTASGHDDGPYGIRLQPYALQFQEIPHSQPWHPLGVNSQVLYA